jgi:hypothetical protein
LHGYYQDKLGKLFLRDATLKRPFHSVYTAATYNLGPQTVCFPHIDFANLPFGYCAVTALGQYDYKKGGHLVIWDWKLIIEFPPGSTILLLSGVLKHSNTAISSDEVRYSFTQYSAGGLFRWVDNHFQTAEEYRKTLDAAQRQVYDKGNADRWKLGLGLLPQAPGVGLA